jgi:hypothetical protein
MSNIERIQKEGTELLLSSGWERPKVDSLVRCLIDFTSQAFNDEMYKDAKVELWEDEQEQTLDIIWQTDSLDVRVILYDEIAAHWDLFAGKIVDGIKVESESSGFGGSGRFGEYNGYELEEDNKWAFHFYWWLEDYLKPQSDNN